VSYCSSYGSNRGAIRYSVDAELRILGRGDADLLSSAAPGVFDHALDPKLVPEFLADARHHLVVAVLDGCVIGFVSAVHYVHPDKPAELWLNELGVSPAHQNHGVGRQLVEAALNLGRELRCVNAWVLTDRANGAAMRVYRAAGGVEASTPPVMFEFDLEANAS